MMQDLRLFKRHYQYIYHLICQLTPAKNFPHNPICTMLATTTALNNPAVYKFKMV